MTESRVKRIPPLGFSYDFIPLTQFAALRTGFLVWFTG